MGFQSSLGTLLTVTLRYILPANFSHPDRSQTTLQQLSSCVLGGTHKTHDYNHSYRPSEAPDQAVLKGQPAEVRVPVALRVQANSQSCVYWREREE